MSIEIPNLQKSMIAKINEGNLATIKLAFMAGVYISIGATLYGLVTSIESANLWRFLGAMLFTIGLILVIFKKAQLFTGNNLMVLNVLFKDSKPKVIIRNWLLVYLGNFLGSIVIAVSLSLIFKNSLPISENLMAIAHKKTSYPFMTSFYKAILCNILVCIAVTFGITLKKTFHKIIGIIIPITLFVFLGFEHSIANMFFIPIGLSFSQATFIESFQLFSMNIIPVTLGNIVGGSIVAYTIYKIKLSKDA
jgi:formate/nitrite transporter